MRVKQLIASQKYAISEARGKTAEVVSWVDRVEGEISSRSNANNINSLSVNDGIIPPASIIVINKLAVVKDSGCRCVVM